VNDPLQKSGPDRFRDEAGTLAALRERRKGVLTPLVGEYHGRIVKVIGDSAFAVAVNRPGFVGGSNS
jgi:class 3 adenylate cyclase